MVLMIMIVFYDDVSDYNSNDENDQTTKHMRLRNEVRLQELQHMHGAFLLLWLHTDATSIN